jgi:hypothetical protein
MTEGTEARLFDVNALPQRCLADTSAAARGMAWMRVPLRAPASWCSVALGLVLVAF